MSNSIGGLKTVRTNWRKKMKKYLLLSTALLLTLLLGISVPSLKPQIVGATAQSCGYLAAFRPLVGNIGAGVDVTTNQFRWTEFTPGFSYPRLREFPLANVNLLTAAHPSPTLFQGMNVKLSVEGQWIVLKWEIAHFEVQTGDEAHPRGSLQGQAVITIDPKYGNGPTITELWFWSDYLEVSGKGGSAKFGSARPYPDNHSDMLSGPHAETVQLSNEGEQLLLQFDTPRITPTGVIIDSLRIVNPARNMNFVIGQVTLQFPSTAFVPNSACN